MDDEDYKVIDNMEKYGGSFVQALAVCFLRADPKNLLKLRLSFHEYWDEYKNFKENK